MTIPDQPPAAYSVDRNTGGPVDYSSPKSVAPIQAKALAVASNITSAITVSGDNVTVSSTDDSNPNVTIANKYELNVHSPNIKYTATLTYKANVAVNQERFDFIVLGKTVSVMTRDLQLIPFDASSEYYSDFYTPKVLKFNGGLSFLGNDTMQSMDVKSYDANNSIVSFYADYYLNHPHFFIDTSGQPVDQSAQTRSTGDSYSTSVAFSINPGGAPKSLVKTRQPYGYDATVVFTNHPDAETLAGVNAVAYGTEDTSSPLYGTRGLLPRGFGWTKAVFVSGQTGADLDNATFKALTDKMYGDGAEIAPHTITPGVDSRDVVASGLQTLSQYQARNWIDHGLTNNLEDLANRGAIKGDANYVLDILDAFNYKLAWTYIDFPLINSDPNLLNPSGTNWIRPFFFYNSNVDNNAGDNSKIYLWSTLSSYPAPDLVYTSANVDGLILARGVSVDHDYFGQAADQNHTWYINPSTNKAEIYPAFDNELAYMQSKRAAGLLWTPTMAAFGDYLILLSNVSISTNADSTFTVTNNNAVPIEGLTLLAESAISSVKLNGATLRTFGGSYGTKEIVIPSLAGGASATLAVSYGANSALTTLTTVTSSARTSVHGQSVTMTANVLPSAATGSVIFADGNTTLGSGSLIGGRATFSTSTLSVGSHSVSATYNGDASYNGSTSQAMIQTVSPAGSNTLYESYHATEQGTSLGTYAVQTFTPKTTHIVKQVKLNLYNSGATGALTVSIRATNPSTGEPTGPDLAASGGMSETAMPAAFNITTFDLGSGYQLQAGTKYAIYLRSTATGLFSMVDTAATYSGGSYMVSSDGLSWTHRDLWDIYFEEWGAPSNSSSPSVITNAASNVTTTSVTLNGNLTALGSASSVNVSFDYGLTSSYGNATSVQVKAVPGTFSANVGSLNPGTPYHFRAKADGGSAGLVYGSDQQFTTSSAGSNALYESYHATEQGTSLGTYAVQTFTPKTTHTVKQVKLNLYNSGATGALTVSIRATNPSTGEPTGADLATSVGMSETAMPAAFNITTFDLGGGYQLQAGTKYAIYLHSTATGLFSMVDTAATYSGGSFMVSGDGLSWTHRDLWDIYFEEWGSP